MEKFDENLVYVNDIEVYRPFLVARGSRKAFPNPDMVDQSSFLPVDSKQSMGIK